MGDGDTGPPETDLDSLRQERAARDARQDPIGQTISSGLGASEYEDRIRRTRPATMVISDTNVLISDVNRTASKFSTAGSMASSKYLSILDGNPRGVPKERQGESARSSCGFGLSRWRLGRFDEAGRILERMIWPNPGDNQGVRFLIDDDRARRAWREDQGRR